MTTNARRFLITVSASMTALLVAHPAAHAAFMPGGLSNVVVWLDATDIDGDGVAGGSFSLGVQNRWNDKSGLYHDFTIFNGGNISPTLNPTGINGLPAVSFDGINDQMVAAGSAGISGRPTTSYVIATNKPFTFFLVERHLADHNGFLWASDSGGAQDASRLVNTGQLRIFPGGTDVGTVSTGTHIIAYSTASVFGTPGAYRVNLDGTLLYNNPSFTRANSPANLTLGILPISLIQPYSGLMGEIIIYDRLLTAEETRMVGAYLQSKWGANGTYGVPEPASAAVLLVLGCVHRMTRRARGIADR